MGEADRAGDRGQLAMSPSISRQRQSLNLPNIGAICCFEKAELIVEGLFQRSLGADQDG
jgi:hypothetical protein